VHAADVDLAREVLDTVDRESVPAVQAIPGGPIRVLDNP
jgi:hypothetical protein